MTWVELLGLIRARWYWVASLALCGLVLAWFVTAITPPQYQTMATLYVSYVPNASGEANIYQGSLLVDSRVRSFPALVDSPFVLGPVIDELGLDEDVESLASQVTASNPVGTVLLEVSAEGANAEAVAELANAVSASYGAYVEEQVQAQAPTDDEAETIAPLSVSVAVPAAIPGSPSWPKPRTNLLLGLMMGTALGFVVMVTRSSPQTARREQVQES